ncbi:hypothetical protein FNF28_06041 [Cafeteria roenbergensis]|uniref:methionine synthase n=1 Tax=Cafeteria roenbergensis TaxID=33653 RepID=A0A5A8D4P9_CAFRO|nr:hypothetical protein FNF28_06041 [Cafeteria roenbergensis]
MEFVRGETDLFDYLNHMLKKRIMIIDGAMGTMIQVSRAATSVVPSNTARIGPSREQRQFDEAAFRGERFADYDRDIQGNNDVLSLTQPDAIREIHTQYLEAGADFVETNTFSGTTIAQADYGMEDLVHELNVEALMEGGVDVILVETIFDTLHAKAALLCRGRGLGGRPQAPVFVSGTIVDQSGRTLSGQTGEAFFTSIRHASLRGPAPTAPRDQQMKPFMGGTSRHSPRALLNLAGGCCGSTPDHIAAVAAAMEGMPPREWKPWEPRMMLSGLEHLCVDFATIGFVNIGERCNIAGSRKFKRLILNGDYAAAMDVARAQVEDGAQVIDINLDDGMLDGYKAMGKFLRIASTEPDIARVPFMVDSSKFEIVEYGLKNTQGKCIVNSISLKVGEEEFIRQARVVKRFGAAVVLMAFDEDGQAASEEDKIRICKRSYDLITGPKVGFPPEDIIFDPNILTIATGMDEHNRYAPGLYQLQSRASRRSARTSSPKGLDPDTDDDSMFRGQGAPRHVKGDVHDIGKKHPQLCRAPHAAAYVGLEHHSFQAWELRGKYPNRGYPGIFKDATVGAEAKKLFDEATEMLERAFTEGWLTAAGVVGMFPANSDGDDILVFPDEAAREAGAAADRLCGLRQQAEKETEDPYLCQSDFVAPVGSGVKDHVGGFAVAIFGAEAKCEEFLADHDDYSRILLQALADRLAEAFAEKLHQDMRRETWGYAPAEDLSPDDLLKCKYQGIRPAPGYPTQPDHTEKRTLWKLLGAEERAGIQADRVPRHVPPAAVSALVFADPGSQYFAVGNIDRDQVKDYAAPARDVGIGPASGI